MSPYELEKVQYILEYSHVSWAQNAIKTDQNGAFATGESNDTYTTNTEQTQSFVQPCPGTTLPGTGGLKLGGLKPAWFLFPGHKS